MKIVDIAARAKEYSRARWGRPRPGATDFRSYALDGNRRDELLAGATTDLERLMFEHTGRLVHKWTHYPQIYERHLSSYRGTAFRFLEIGVSQGGSLEVWREYFGPDATIFGVDIDPACAGRADPPNEVRIGSQDDPGFLRSVVEEMGGVDVVLDDGSHVAGHQRTTFDALFPLLDDDGLYLVEDLHTSYWPGFHEGGHKRAGTAVEGLKTIIDDLHGWYHRKGTDLVEARQVKALHVYDSIAVIEKCQRSRPAHIKLL